MAVLTQRTAEWIRSEYGVEPAHEKGVEAASQTFKKGQFLYLVAGKLTICADDAQVIYALAQQDASGTTDTSLDIIRVREGDIFAASVYHSTAASAVTAQAQVGENYALQVDSNKCYVDIEDTTNVAFRVIGICLIAGEAIGDRFGRVYFKVQSNYIQSNQAG